MKKQLIILALLLVCGTATFAQNTFNNQSFETMMSRYVKDPMQYLNSEAAPDLVMVGANGLITDINGIQGLVNSTSSSTWEYSDIKTRQYGSTGVAVFRMKHTHDFKSGKVGIYDEIWTAVYTEKDGKWLLVSWGLTAIPKK